MNSLLKRKSFLVLLLSSLVLFNTGCSAIENTAMGLENDIQTTITDNTTIDTTMTLETTTNVLNYNPDLSVCSLYEPITTTIEDFSTEMTTILTETVTTTVEDTTYFDNNSTLDTSNTTLDTTTTIVTTTPEETTTAKTTKMFETIPTTTTTTAYVETQAPTIDTSYLFTDCAFIGDSLTVGMGMYDFIPKEYSFAQEGCSIPNMNKLQLNIGYGYCYPAQAISYWQSKHVFILLGINGVSWLSNDTTIDSYTQLINTILEYNPNVEDINVISVLPVAYSMETKASVEDGRILNSEIDALNQRLQAMANNLNVNYLDINSKLKNDYGYLPDDLTVDGLHLTKNGYEIVRNSLLEYIQESLG